MILVEVYFVAAVDVNPGTIAGDVKFVDSPSKMTPVKVTKDQDYCGETLPNESYLGDTNADSGEYFDSPQRMGFGQGL